MQFRTKARAVDLLGKGQIADLPTAITELWKNGYDAYADNITADVYLKGYKNLKTSWFVITDDGIGMDREDAKLAFSRHATSKLLKEDDLFFINTLGFILI